MRSARLAFAFAFLLYRVLTASAQADSVGVVGKQSSAAQPSLQEIWQLQNSGTMEGLRGIDSVDGVVAWASGTGGIVLRTTDGGAQWQRCPTPDEDTDGVTLDFRGIQAWDAQTAVVMASGPGDKSRLYKTTDGCKTWKLLFVNPDAPKGFFDSFWLNGPHGILLGDPVQDRFTVFLSEDAGKTWKQDKHPGLSLGGRSLAAFAASNSCVAIGNRLFTRGFAAGGAGGSFFFSRPFIEGEDRQGIVGRLIKKPLPWRSRPIPISSPSPTSGAFSVAYRYPLTEGICQDCGFDENSAFVAVGGDYSKPDQSGHIAAWSSDGGWTWTASGIPPHGYRSAVEWSVALKAWVTVGANGSDISRDDGRTWRSLENGNWNALSLPFVVGPQGRIARLNAPAIPKP